MSDSKRLNLDPLHENTGASLIGTGSVGGQIQAQTQGYAQAEHRPARNLQRRIAHGQVYLDGNRLSVLDDFGTLWAFEGCPGEDSAKWVPYPQLPDRT